MPTRRKSKDIRNELAEILAQSDKRGLTAKEYAEATGINFQNASSTLRRMKASGIVRSETVFRPDARGRRQKTPFYILRTEQLSFDKVPPVGTRRERRRVKSWDELTPGEQEARVRSREYYREQQRRKGKIVKPRLDNEEGYRYTSQTRGKVRSARTTLLESSERLAKAAEILFPNGLKATEAFFAWVDLTREMMNG